MLWMRWHRYVELGLLVLALVVLGAIHFSQITPEQQREIELEAGLEQLYLIEQAHFARHDRYFDPTDLVEGLDWKWMEAYEWEFKAGKDSFWLVAKADLDGDGQIGIWGVDDRGPQARRLMDD